MKDDLDIARGIIAALGLSLAFWAFVWFAVEATHSIENYYQEPERVCRGWHGHRVPCALDRRRQP